MSKYDSSSDSDSEYSSGCNSDSADSADEWEYIKGKPGGGNEGAIYKDEHGVEWLIKFSNNPKMICNEILANQLYKALKIPVPELKAVNYKGRFAVASKMLPRPYPTDTPPEWKLAWPGFGADVWLRNWDVATYGNLITSNGKVYRIDTGGALVFRALGGMKPGTFTDVSMSEINALRNPQMNRAGARVFGPMIESDIKKSIQKVVNLSASKIRSVVNKYWIPSERDKMYNWLIRRQAALKDLL